MNPSTTTAAKTLQNMPAAIGWSTLQVRPGFVGGCFRSLEGGLFGIVHWVTWLAPLGVLTWLVPFLPFDSRADALVTQRFALTGFFAGLFALCVLYRLLELYMAVPRADPEYPVVLADSLLYSLLRRTEYGLTLPETTAVFSGLLWLSWWNDMQPWAGTVHTLTFACINTGLAIVMYLYGRFLPYHGFREPSEADKDYMRRGAYGDKLQGRTRTAAETAPSAVAEPEYATPVEARQARTSFKDIYGMEEVKQRLLEPAQRIIAARVDSAEPPGNGILMHGEPGNGKTGFAEALAGELNVPLVTLTYGQVASKWVGDAPKMITNCFAYAKAHAPCVFFIDEMDSFLRSRDSGSNNSEDLKITNTLLTEMVELRNHRVVLAGATNYLSLLDAAAIREGRFDYKVEITPPDEPARIGLLQKCAAKYGGHLDVDQEALLSVAKRWNGFSVARLLAVGKALPEYAKSKGTGRIGYDEWQAALRLVQGRKGRPPTDTKPLKDLILDVNTREALELIAGRLKDALHIESMGGTLPSGILFHGPSGTGKTAAARALAVDSGWAFLSVAGPDLLADRDKINKVFAEAKDLRPTLVFIDEADDALRNRQYTSTPDIVNRMLALMDGAGEKVKDVVFIAATNNPDQVDPALVRAGRFTEKVEFFLPPAELVPRAIANWLKSKRALLEPDNDAFEVAELLRGQSMANVEGILQYALNHAIPRTQKGAALILTRKDLAAGVKVISSDITAA